MTSLYLQNHDVHARVLVTGPDLARFEERPRDALPAGAQKMRAFWVEFDGEPIGVYASPTGPVMFAGDRRLQLAPGRSKAVVHAMPGGRRMFQLVHDGQPWVTVDYDEPLSTGGAWDDDETLDFYTWISKEVEDPKFFDYWTAPIPA
jgi:hypothetical protein